MAESAFGNGLQDGYHLYSTDLTALNSSGISGKATVLVDEKAQQVSVVIDAKGLEPGAVHAQHIHGFADDSDAVSPTIAQDSDGDGFVELGEGLDSYGPIQLNLTTNPEDSAHDHGAGGHDHTANAAFPTAGADGSLHYEEVFRFDADDPNAAAIFDGITPMEMKEIVLHGLTVPEGRGAGTPGEVDGSAGYKAVLPVAAGEMVEASNPHDTFAALQEAPGLAPPIDWNAVAAQVEANHDATGYWYL